jgi:GDP-4-dehydro-6-deoxy-D-mannose reductase
MRIAVTGAAGFVGRHAVRELTANGHAVFALDLKADPSCGAFTACDIRDATAVAGAVRGLRPDACLHLAGSAFVPQTDADPLQAYVVNVMGTIHVLEALRRYAPGARLLVVSTAQVYGSAAAGSAAAPLDESAPLRPETLYALTKAAADQAALFYASHYGLCAMTARPHNHIGPGQAPLYVVPAFAAQLKAIAAGHSPAEMKVGNLESRRDFTDVRDVVRAYRLLLEKGRAGEAYNIASGSLVGIGDLLRQLCAIAGLQPRLIVDPQRLRATDCSPRLATARLRAATGWEPRIPLTASLNDIWQAQ